MPYNICLTKKPPHERGQIDTGPLTGPFSGFRNRMPDLFISTGIHDHLQRVFGCCSKELRVFQGFNNFKGDPGDFKPANRIYNNSFLFR